MFHVAYPRGQGPAFADLPPTLQPCAIATSAPPSDHLRTAAFSGLIYGSLVGGLFAISNLTPPPVQVAAPPQPPGPTFVYEPSRELRVTLPQPGVAQGGGGHSEPASPLPTTPSNVVPTEAPAGLPTENHAFDPVRIGPGTSNVPSQGAPVSTPGAGSSVQDFTAVGLSVLHQVDPIYPEFARKARIQGPVVLLMTVDEQGQPTQVAVLEGHPVFHEVAKQAARQWRFEPARLDGRPVSATFRLTLKFSLR
jgi:protein TonB